MRECALTLFRFARVALFAAVALALAPRPARAAIESPLVQKGVEAFRAADYEHAVAFLERALTESLTREEKLITFQTLALAHAALDQPALARADFGRLLRLQPGFTLDRTVAPKVRALLEQAKAETATRGVSMEARLPAVTPEHRPDRPVEGRSLAIGVLYPGGAAKRLAVYYRARGQAAFARAEANESGAGRFMVELAGDLVRAPALEYHLTLLDEVGAAVAGAGSLGQPLSIDVSPARKPLYRRGWFWGVLGATTAAGATAALLAVFLTRPSTTALTLNVR